MVPTITKLGDTIRHDHCASVRVTGLVAVQTNVPRGPSTQSHLTFTISMRAEMIMNSVSIDVIHTTILFGLPRSPAMSDATRTA